MVALTVISLEIKFIVTDQNEVLMRECINLAKESAKVGDPPFGSILVLDGEIVVRARNTSINESNFLRHAEMNALSQAVAKYKPDDISRMAIFAGSEPCPMCSGAIYWSGIKKVVFGSRRSKLSEIRGFGLNVASEEILSKGSHSIEVVGPVLENEICEIYRSYYKK